LAWCVNGPGVIRDGECLIFFIFVQTSMWSLTKVTRCMFLYKCQLLTREGTREGETWDCSKLWCSSNPRSSMVEQVRSNRGVWWSNRTESKVFVAWMWMSSSPNGSYFGVFYRKCIAEICGKEGGTWNFTIEAALWVGSHFLVARATYQKWLLLVMIFVLVYSSRQLTFVGSLAYKFNLSTYYCRIFSAQS